MGTDLAKVLKIENIYFDYDKANIRKDAAEELAKIVAIMKEHPTMKVDVRLHTDSRGSDKYNLALSERRAKSTIKWIVSHGIKKNRITGKGYGETQLVNGCSNGVPCTEEEHQANRYSNLPKITACHTTTFGKVFNFVTYSNSVFRKIFLQNVSKIFGSYNY